MIIDDNPKIYHRRDSAVFWKTKEKFGGLSNMASGFPIYIDGVTYRSSEALYQCCRFPHLPKVQRKIVKESNALLSKRACEPYRTQSRIDWDNIRVNIMRWCLRAKLAFNWETFGNLLLSTGDMPIVEQSSKDDFWGAKPTDDETLVGTNVLGNLLVELRERLREHGTRLQIVAPPKIEDFLLFEQPVPKLFAPNFSRAAVSSYIDTYNVHEAIASHINPVLPITLNLYVTEPEILPQIPSQDIVASKVGSNGLVLFGDLPLQESSDNLSHVLFDASEQLDAWTRYVLEYVHQFGNKGVPELEAARLADAQGLELSSLAGTNGILTSDKKKEEACSLDSDQTHDCNQKYLRLRSWKQRKKNDLGEPKRSDDLRVIDALHRLLRDWTLGDVIGAARYVERFGLCENELFWRVAQVSVEMGVFAQKERFILHEIFTWTQNGMPNSHTIADEVKHGYGNQLSATIAMNFEPTAEQETIKQCDKVD